MRNITELAAKLNHTAKALINTPSFEAWVTCPLQIVLPHKGMLCGQSIAHAGGYTAVHMHSVDLPKTYLQTILCHGNNVRGPVFANLMQAKGIPQFFCAARDGETVAPGWLQRLQTDGWNTLMGLSYAEGEDDDRVLTTAGFYNAQQETEHKMSALQSTVMPVLHGSMTHLLEATSQPKSGSYPVAGNTHIGLKVPSVGAILSLT